MREISDEIVQFDPETLQSVPVLRESVLELFEGQSFALKVIQSIPHREGFFVQEAVNDLLIRVHCEMQRLSEEFQHGRKVDELLRPVLEAVKSRGHRGRLRIVDVGCGTGYVIRWLARHSTLRSEIELIGCDFNSALVQEATRLAQLESLNCKFLHKNAFNLSEPGHIYISTGVLHHFADSSLGDFFANQDHSGAFGMIHIDFNPWKLAPLGSWLFHHLRMREPLCWHDGVISTKRAYGARHLLQSLNHYTTYKAAIFRRTIGRTPMPRVFQNLVAFRPDVFEAYKLALGSKASQLEVLDG